MLKGERPAREPRPARHVNASTAIAATPGPKRNSGGRFFKFSRVRLSAASFQADWQITSNVSRRGPYKSSTCSPVTFIITCPVTPVISASPQVLTKLKPPEPKHPICSLLLYRSVLDLCLSLCRSYKTLFQPTKTSWSVSVLMTILAKLRTSLDLGDMTVTGRAFPWSLNSTGTWSSSARPNPYWLLPCSKISLLRCLILLSWTRPLTPSTLSSLVTLLGNTQISSVILLVPWVPSLIFQTSLMLLLPSFQVWGR